METSTMSSQETMELDYLGTVVTSASYIECITLEGADNQIEVEPHEVDIVPSILDQV